MTFRKVRAQGGHAVAGEPQAELIKNGNLKAVLDKVYPFEQIAEGLAYLEGGRVKGKVVVTFA